MPSFHAEALTWTGLLAQWVQFAQASLALPEAADGPRWRQSVPAVINLQAVTFALADLQRLPQDEQALGLDRAELLIGENAHRLRTIWASALPASLKEIIDDSQIALAAAGKGD
jgi:hypothetical protein